MTPEVRDRIEQIRHGNVPEGYKRTKTAVVPNEWKDVPIAPYLCEYIERTTIPNQHPVLTSARKGLMLQTEYYSNRQVTTEDNVGYYVLPYGYVTFRSRSDDGRFRFNENKIIERGIISYFYPVFSFSPLVCHDYMLQLLNETIYRKMYPYIEGTAQQVLSMKKLGQLVYSLPPLGEQQRIAEILTTQDKVIKLKEKRLAEKQRQKKYLMQQLLTGKKRLPGFDVEWISIPIGSFVHELDERTTCNNQHEILSVTKGGIVRQSDHFKKQIASEDSTGYKILRRGNLAFSTMNLWMGSVDVLENYEIGIISPAYKVFSFDSKMMDTGFGKQFMRSEFMIWLYKSNSEQGASVVRRNLDLKALLSAKVKIPSLKEQVAIANILSAADKEIELLRQDLEQEKQKKKALMQLLLTGIVRV